MKVYGWILLLGVIAFSGAFGGLSTPAQAQSSDEDVFDLKTVTCRDMLKTEGEEQSYLLILLHGYISGQNSDTIIDGPVLTVATDNIMDACIDNPESPLLSVFETYR